MKTADVPPIPAGLVSLCTILSPWADTSQISILNDAVSNNRTDWQAIALYANLANLAPALRPALIEKGLWDAVPALLQEYLNEMYRLNAERNHALSQQLYEVVALLNKTGITPLPLKGAAALAADIFPDSAVRFMLDLDILIPEDLLLPAVSLLMDAGYTVVESRRENIHYWKLENDKHYPSLVKHGAAAHLEIHHKVLHAREEYLLETGKVWQDSRIMQSDRMKGVSFAMMSPTHQVLHCIIHSEISHGNHKLGRLDLRQLFNFAHLCKRYEGEIEWELLTAVMKDDSSMGEVLRAYIHTAHELFGVNTPLTVEPTAAARRHFARIIRFHVGGKWKRLRMFRREIAHIMEAFSEQGLRTRFPERESCSAGRLRFDLIKVLLGRYPSIEKLNGYLAKYSRFG